MSSLEQKLTAGDCEIRFDNLTRQLYATDASVYQIEPAAVAFPRTAQQASAAIKAAIDSGLTVTPRGAGTGLVGGAIGDGLVIDFARYNRQITDLNLQKRTVRVGAGVVLDQLNAFLKPHEFCFGPDVATSSRATLGGMIANNSSGSHTPIYGTTADHVVSLEVVLADGRIATAGAGSDLLCREAEAVADVVEQHSNEIARRMPPGLLKRWPGYGVDRWLRWPGNLADIFAGSEGTLAGIMSAELQIVPVPKAKGAGLIFFSSVADAMQATVDLLELKPAAIEHIDRVLFDQTKGQLAFRAARDLLELDAKPCESFLVVEFFNDDISDRLAELAKRNLGLRTLILKNTAEANLVWNMRKAGLSLLTARKGAAKPVTCVEDAAIRPEKLPAYVRSLQKIMDARGLEASFYGHAASGLLHVRPVLDLHNADGLRKFREVSNEVSSLVSEFKGSLAAEHGVGIARTEYMPQQLGPELLGAFRDIKAIFDPKDVFNPGKLLDAGRYKIDTKLRVGTGDPPKVPFEPMLAFASRDESFVANLEQCNGCGGCRKDAPTMCPTFVATGEEIMSTRGRANAIRAALEMRGTGDDPLRCSELETALSNCLSCKACTTECPSNVNMALLKAELIHARWKRDGLPLSVRMFSNVDLLGRLGSATAAFSNAMLKARLPRKLAQKFFGISADRPLPPYANERFDHWFGSRQNGSSQAKRGKVILWDDTFVRYHEPHIGKAAVAVLEKAGFEVLLAKGRKCCGRPAFSQGNLDEAKKLGLHNVQLLATNEDLKDPSIPILFLEPSCYSMFAEDYRELRIDGAESLAKRCFLFEQFIDKLLNREPESLPFNARAENIAIHAHCHAKSLLNPSFMTKLIQRLSERKVTLLETGCCGMAGAFGALESKYELSLKVAEPLVQKINAQPTGTTLIASGTSCRHQIEHLTVCKPKHMAEVLAAALK